MLLTKSRAVVELSRFAESQPHVAFCAFMSCIVAGCIVLPMGEVYQPLEDVISQGFIPVSTS